MTITEKNNAKLTPLASQQPVGAGRIFPQDVRAHG